MKPYCRRLEKIPYERGLNKDLMSISKRVDSQVERDEIKRLLQQGPGEGLLVDHRVCKPEDSDSLNIASK